MHSDVPLSALFSPAAVAVIGASRHAEKIGHTVVSNLLNSGYKGKIIPVNPAADRILGLPAVAGAENLPPGVDLAVVCLPREAVLACVETLAERGVRAAIVITAGFKETGRDGYRLEEALAAVAKRRRMALLGPNCLGLINPPAGLNASFAAKEPKSGSIAFFSQSGALCVAVLDWALGEGLGFSKFISLGNKAVLHEAHMLTALADDPDTRVIIGYCESVENGQELMATAQRVTAKKPVIMIKAGSTPAGARAASSHTGSVAGWSHAYETAFRQSGIIQVEDVETLFGLARAFAGQPLPQGPNVAVVTNSGGPGILAADACENSRLQLMRPSAATIDRLRSFLPSFASLYNPIDIIGDADAARYRATLEAVAADELVHALLVMLSPTASADIEATAQAVIDVSRSFGKPVFACFMGGARIAKGRDLLLAAGVPCYAFPEPAIRALESMHDYHMWQTRTHPVEVCFRRDKGKAEAIIAQARRQGLSELPQERAMDLALAYELPVPETRFARTSDEAVRHAKKIGFPVALKIVSPQVARRSEVGGVTLDIPGPAELRHAFLELTSRVARAREDVHISGCQVQAMAPPGTRAVAITLKRDPQFGPLISFGLAGPYSDVLHDISSRLAPLTVGDAHDMVREIRTFPLLRGVRGQKPAAIRAIEDILLTVSQLAVDFPAVAEAEFNPVLVDEERAFIADVKVTLA